jgi:hypothetical protein
MKRLPNHPIDPKHFERNVKFRSHPEDAFPKPWLHPLPAPKTFDQLCREVKANVLNLAYSEDSYHANRHLLNTSFMGENVYSFILPNGKEIVLGA